MPYGTKILPYGKTLAILPNKKGGKCVNTYRPGRLGEFVEAFFPVDASTEFWPRQCSRTTGAAFYLFVSNSISIRRLRA